MLARIHRSTWAASALIALATAWTASPARASFLDGQTLNFQISDTALSPSVLLGPTQFVVNNTVEVGIANTPNVGNFNMEVDDNTITFTYTQLANFSTAAFNGYIFRAISPTSSDFGGVSIDSATTLAGFDSSRVSFDGTSISINVSGLTATAGTVLKFDVLPAAGVPEPSSLFLAGSGLLAVGGSARARRRA